MHLHPDRAAAAVIIAAACAVLGMTFTFPEVPRAVQQGMGPERFPQLVLFVLIGLCLILAVQAVRRPAVTPEPIEAAVVLTMAGGALFMGAVQVVGMTAATGLAILGLGVLWGERRFGLLVLNAVLLPAVLWAVFVRGLKVPLPAGLLGKLLGV